MTVNPSPRIQSGRTHPRLATLFRTLFAALVVLLCLGATGATDPSARFNDLGHKMMCTCGCNQVLLECNHVGCTVSGGMRNELSQQIASGQNDSLILQSFVQEYGATVLAAPTLHGLDLLAWIMPFAVSLLALGGTIYLVRHWARQQPAPAPARTPEEARAFEAMRERIRRETQEDIQP
jgi:cytochrome c-type biogenesis protein CcmH